MHQTWEEPVDHNSQPNLKPIIQHAGVVAYRQVTNGEIEILLITAHSHPESWIFPLGSVDPGETLQEAASRECTEESGYIVEIDAKVGNVDLNKADSVHRATFFTGRVIGEVNHYEAGRLRKWVRQSELIHFVADIFKPIAQTVMIKSCVIRRQSRAATEPPSVRCNSTHP